MRTVTLNPSVTDVLSELIGANWGKIENLGGLIYRDLLRETRTTAAFDERRPRQSSSWFAGLIRKRNDYRSRDRGEHLFVRQVHGDWAGLSDFIF
jgi:hypothetical protein